MCEIGKKFKNLDLYNEQMRQSMNDKLFFLEYLPEKDNYVFVDFGCADGTLLNYLTDIYATMSKKQNGYIGYDISDTMINLARRNFHGDPTTDINYYNDWSLVKTRLKHYGEYYTKKVLILSSVIHEVYSYSNPEQISQFWNNVMDTDFDYIIIRDMCPSKDIERPTGYKIINALNNANEHYQLQLRDFENIWGSIQNNKNAVHFLLKYRYRINWDREVNENYFPIYSEDLLEKITGKEKYSAMYLERFSIPFLVDQIKQDFSIDLEDYTHIKAIFIKSKK